MDYKEFREKTIEDAKTAACVEFGITSDKLDFVVVEEGSSGFLGIGAKQAVINARVKSEDEQASSSQEVKKTETVKKEEKTASVSNDTSAVEKSSEIKKSEEKASEKKSSDTKEKDYSGIDGEKVKADAEKFLKEVTKAMNMEVAMKLEYFPNEGELYVELSGDDMGVLIGKRGQTLDSLQYLTSLVVNKSTSVYVRVKVDTEDYRRRRKETLENLARNMASKAKRTKRTVSLEPMNPYERRVIHSALQSDRYVTTNSEGDEPYRRVVIHPKRY